MPKGFIEFTVSISKLNKKVQKLKLDGMKAYDLKGTHTICIYQLMGKTKGLTPTEIAECCDFDPGLVSRTLRELAERGIVCKDGQPGKYFCRYTLSEKGKKIAAEIDRTASEVQNFVDQGISQQELDVFYEVLEKLEHNFQMLGTTGK